MGKMKNLFLILLVLSLAITAGSCGGDGGGGSAGPTSTMTLTQNYTSTTFTDGTTNSSGYYDPSFSADVYPAPRTLVTMCSGVSAGTCAKLVNVSAGGATPGSYTIDCSSTYVTYTYDSFPYFCKSGTVTLASVGAVGEPITGSFNAVLSLSGYQSITIDLSGTFSVIRDH